MQKHVVAGLSDGTATIYFLPTSECIVYITNQSTSLENAAPLPQLQPTIMTPSKPEPMSDDGSKKAEPASGGSSDTIRQVAPDSRPGYGNSPSLMPSCPHCLITIQL
jgi:hypothetical protein